MHHQLGDITTIPVYSHKPLQLIFSDVWGSTPIISLEGYQHYDLFEDDFSCFSLIYPLKLKYEVKNVFLQLTLVENLFQTKIQTVQTDWRGEYRVLEPTFTEFGIEFQHSRPHTHNQNSKIKHTHTCITETTLSLLAQ